MMCPRCHKDKAYPIAETTDRHVCKGCNATFFPTKLQLAGGKD